MVFKAYLNSLDFTIGMDVYQEQVILYSSSGKCFIWDLHNNYSPIFNDKYISYNK